MTSNIIQNNHRNGLNGCYCSRIAYWILYLYIIIYRIHLHFQCFVFILTMSLCTVIVSVADILYEIPRPIKNNDLRKKHKRHFRCVAFSHFRRWFLHTEKGQCACMCAKYGFVFLVYFLFLLPDANFQQNMVLEIYTYINLDFHMLFYVNIPLHPIQKTIS